MRCPLRLPSTAARSTVVGLTATVVEFTAVNSTVRLTVHFMVGTFVRKLFPEFIPGTRFTEAHFNHAFVNGFRFRPRVGVGFGVFLGYPFGYPYYDPWAYWNYPVGPLTYVPGQGYGGVSFSISPADASVTVDGIYAGVVDQYDNPQSPLNLPPGEHRITIEAPGYKTLDFNVNVERGEVLPYAGDLQHD